MLLQHQRRQINAEWERKYWTEVLEDIVMARLKNWSINNIKEHLINNPSKFQSEGIINTYQKMKNSTMLLHRICFLQCPDPLQFMEDIEDCFNFKGYGGDKKRNTVWIHCPPGCEKTRVLNILCSLALVVARPESAAKDKNLLGMIALSVVKFFWMKLVGQGNIMKMLKKYLKENNL